MIFAAKDLGRVGSRVRRGVAAWVGLTLAGWMVASGCNSDPDATEGLEEPVATEQAPDFKLVDLDGREHTLSAYRGRTVIVDFWATWCAPCVFQVPELNKLWKARSAEGLVVLGVAIDVEGAEVVAPWVEEQGVEYPILLGDEDLAQRFGAYGFPTLVIVRPDGSIDSRHVGLIELSELETLIQGAGA
ncbi:TlpA family protein disulfide reductase [Myxococcota bacterium]|nr:TlpA family protein disulfide reductase [Myxococcota bacterium]